jgi:hypothetical protein
MNQHAFLEDRLESLGAALRARPSLHERVMDQVRQSAALRSTRELSTRSSRFQFGRRPRFLAASAGTFATIAAAMLFAITLFPSESVGWEEVAKAIQTQKWIRGSASLADGKDAKMWMSPARQTWAFHLGGSFYFYDGRDKIKYEYLGGDKPITKLPLGEDDAQRVLPIDALLQDKGAIGPWLLGSEKIVEQKRQETKEGGKTWIEFHLVLSRGEMNQATLRVDPETRLPVSLLTTSSKDKNKSFKWTFDYPKEGPADIYGLGVSRDVKIDDRMPADNVLKVLAAIAASRAKIGDFELIVGQSSNFSSSVVYRKGNQWRIDSWRPHVAVDSLPGAQDWGKIFKDQLLLSPPTPLFVCNGATVWENTNVQSRDKLQWEVSQRTAPQDLMSGEGLGTLSMAPGAKIASLLFPDLSPKVGWSFEFDPNPADAPGYVVLKRSTRVTWPKGSVAHEWYYLDPAMGYAVVRAELFNLPPNTPADPKASTGRQTIRMEDFQQSPQGFYYPTVIRDSRPGIGGDQPIKSLARYYFDFNVKLPDSLFTINGAQEPSK